MLKKLLICAILLMFIMPVCFAVDLDAPAQKNITLKSEMQRGWEAVWSACSGKYRLIDVINAIDYVLNKNTQNNTDTDAFKIGTYFATLMQIDVYEDQKNTDLYKTNLSYYYKNLREKQRDLDLTDKQIAEALEVGEGYLINSLNKWDTQVNGAAASK